MGIREWMLGGAAPACQAARDDLKYCILESDCVKRDGHTPNECLKGMDGAKMPLECAHLRVAFFECKRSLLDMRTRFRGRKDVFACKEQAIQQHVHTFQLLCPTRTIYSVGEERFLRMKTVDAMLGSYQMACGLH